MSWFNAFDTLFLMSHLCCAAAGRLLGWCCWWGGMKRTLWLMSKKHSADQGRTWADTDSHLQQSPAEETQPKHTNFRDTYWLWTTTDNFEFPRIPLWGTICMDFAFTEHLSQANDCHKDSSAMLLKTMTITLHLYLITSNYVLCRRSSKPGIRTFIQVVLL